MILYYLQMIFNKYHKLDITKKTNYQLFNLFILKIIYEIITWEVP